MFMRHGFWLLLGTLLAVAASSLAVRAGDEGGEFFEKAVRPVLVERCWKCHGGADAKAGGKARIKGGLDMTTRAALLAGGDSGPAAVEGKPEESILIRAIRYHDEPRMPPDRRLGEVEIGQLTRWVERGLPWGVGDVTKTAGSAEKAAPKWTDRARDHWAFRPIADPPVPEVRDEAWPLGPIDRFVLAGMERHGLSPAQTAEKRTLIRRVTFDLTGLPPEPAAVEAFLADDHRGAWARVVDRLLASPDYGEKWGRHWLDLARYADTAGETADYPVREAYLYRNYVVDAFNRDLPYDQFLAEQLAGDLLAREGPPGRRDARIVATGFLAVARRFGFDPQNYHHLTLDDTIDTLGKAVLGLTIACARCHDHKFDPIDGQDYYALYGIFASTRYPHGGSEEKKRPEGFTPLSTGGVAYAVAESDRPADARVLRRGDPTNLGPAVPRRFLAVLGGRDRPPVSRGSGRRELVSWLIDRRNPLTARVLVNRVWQHHFGRGIVATPSDFGTRGTPPSHPELLDWLATRFVAGGWSIKALHRDILLSRAYQMASGDDGASQGSASTQPDPENVWLSHQARRRLDAEDLRDAVLWLGGELEVGPGGPHPFPPVDRWGFTQHAPFQAVYETNRRSVYLMTQRIRRHPFLALFDGADPNASTASRNVTTVPTQALFFLNDPLVHRQAERLAQRLLALPGDDGARIDRAYRLAFARPVTAAERDEALRDLADFRAELSRAGVDAAAAARQAWSGLARTLIASNEFAYVD